MREYYGLFATSQRAQTALLGLVILLLCSVNSSFAQPVFMSFPDDVTVECTQIPPKTPPMATGNCLPINVALSEIETIGACPQTKVIQRIWTATDNCGKSLQQTHTVTIRDSKAPIITFTRQELLGKKSGDTVTLDCRYAYGLGTQDVFVQDNCDNAPTVTFKDNLVRAGNCTIDKYLLFMNCSWVAIDACGNRSESNIYIKFIDITPPEIWGIPADITVECEGQIDFAKAPYYKDYCDGQPTIKEVKNTTTGNCAGNYLITRNWVVTDVCGNSVSAAQVITIKDTNPPVITAKPADVTIKQGDLIPPPGKVTATDNCNQLTYQKLTEEYSASGCDSVLIRTWDVKDACGNSTLAIQKITILTLKADAGKIVADSSVICLQNNKAKITAKETVKPVLPIGYKIIYLLSNKDGVITQTATTPSFDVSLTNNYAIHSLVYDARFDINSIKKDSTTIAQLSQKLNGLCASFDASGAKTRVKICNIIPNDSICVKPNIVSIAVTKTDCDSLNGSISLQVNSKDVTYQWSNNSTNGNSIKDLAQGVYSVTISKVTDKQCFITETIIVNSKNNFTISSPTITPAACNKNNGEVIFSDTTYKYRWFDGKTLSSRNDLAVGTYFVSVTKDNSTCVQIERIEIKENVLLSAEVEILKQPDCGENNGIANIKVENGSGTYTYSWGADAKKTNLVAGIYHITVTDTTSGCKTQVDFELINQIVNDPNLISTTLTNVDCAGNLAKLTIDLKLPTGFSAPAQIRVVDAQNKVYNYSELPAGTYTILVFDANECLVGTKAITVAFPNPIVVTFSINEVLCKGDIEVKTSGGTAPYKYDWSDILGADNQKDRSNIKPGKYPLTVTDAKGCIAITLPEISDKTCGDTCINWIPERNLSVSTKDCAAGAKVCFPIPLDIFKSKISTLHNGKPYNGLVESCRQSPLDSVAYAQLNLAVGNHVLIFTQKRGKNTCHDTVNVKVICDNCPTIYSGGATVKADSCKGTAKICLDVTKQYLTQVKITEKGNPYTDAIGTCSNGNAQLELKTGQYEFEFRDTLWDCNKTLKINVKCDTLKDTPVNSLVIELDMCVGDSFSYCLDTLELNKGPFTVNNLCPVSYKAIKYTLNGLCLKVKADTLGSESLCMYVCDPYKRCDTTYLVFNVKKCTKPSSNIDTIYREIVIQKKDTVCLKASGLASIDTIFNYCLGESGKAVAFSYEKKCVKYEGLAVGTEKGCFVVCDKSGKCDTTIVIVKVKQDIVEPPDTSKKRPVAIKDIASTVLETPITIDILKNDTIKGTLKHLKVYKQPKKGDVYYTQTTQGITSVTYIPKPSTCGVVDTFYYYIEDEFGKDSTSVCVAIVCQQLIIFNGLSPNGDGINDVFTILGIEEFSDNKVMILNRWGNRIFERSGYTNQSGWDGTWGGAEVPDGTYWYHIEIPRLNKVYNGYLELRR